MDRSYRQASSPVKEWRIRKCVEFTQMIGRLYSNLSASDCRCILNSFKPDLTQCDTVTSSRSLKVIVIRLVTELIKGNFFNMDVSRAVGFFHRIENYKAVELLESYKANLEEEVHRYGAILLSDNPVNSERMLQVMTDWKEDSLKNSDLNREMANLGENLEDVPGEQEMGGAAGGMDSEKKNTSDWRKLKMTHESQTTGLEDKITDVKERVDEDEAKEDKVLCNSVCREGGEETRKEQSAGLVEIPVLPEEKVDTIGGVGEKGENREKGLKDESIGGRERQGSVSSEESFVDVRMELEKLCVDCNGPGNPHEVGVTEDAADSGERKQRERTLSQSSLEESFEIVSQDIVSLSVDENGLPISNECSGQVIGESFHKDEAGLEENESSVASEENPLPLEKDLEAGDEEEGLKFCEKQSADEMAEEDTSLDGGKEKKGLNESVKDAMDAEEGMRKLVRKKEDSGGIERQEKPGEKDLVEGVKALDLAAENDGLVTTGVCSNAGRKITFTSPVECCKMCALKMSMVGTADSTNASNLGQRIWDHLVPSGDHFLLPCIFEGLGFTLVRIDDGPEITFTIGLSDKNSWYDLILSVVDGYLEKLLTVFMLSENQEEEAESISPMITIRIDKSSFKECQEYFDFRCSEYVPSKDLPRFLAVLEEYIQWPHSCMGEIFQCGTPVIPDQLLYKCTATKDEYEEWLTQNSRDHMSEVDAMDHGMIGCDGIRCALVENMNCHPRQTKTRYIPAFLFEELSAYHRNLPINEVERVLGTEPDGTFMIWNNIHCRGHCFILSLQCNGLSYHYPITRGPDYKFSLIPEKWFSTLGVLLHHYRQEADGLVTTLEHPYKSYRYRHRRRKEKIQVIERDGVMGSVKNPSLIVKVEYKKEDLPLSEVVHEAWRHWTTIPPRDNVVSLFFDNNDVKLLAINILEGFQVDIHVTVSSLAILQDFQEKILSGVFDKRLPHILLEGASETTRVKVTADFISFTAAREALTPKQIKMEKEENLTRPKPDAAKAVAKIRAARVEHSRKIEDKGFMDIPKRRLQAAESLRVTPSLPLKPCDTEDKEREQSTQDGTFKRRKMDLHQEATAMNCEKVCDGVACDIGRIRRRWPKRKHIPVFLLELYQGRFSLETVVLELCNQPNGTYMVWNNMRCRGQCIVLSVQYNNMSYHYHVTYDSGKQFSVLTRIRFPTFDDLIRHYRGTACGLITALTYPLRYCRWDKQALNFEWPRIAKNEKNPSLIVKVETSDREEIPLSEAARQCMQRLSSWSDDNILSLFFDNHDVKLRGIVRRSNFQFALRVTVSSLENFEKFDKKISSRFFDEYLPHILFDGACDTTRVTVTIDPESFILARHWFVERQSCDSSENSSTEVAGKRSNQQTADEAEKVRAAGSENTESIEDNRMDENIVTETTKAAESLRVMPYHPSESWFCEDINMVQASEILSQLPVGTFLVSNSESEGAKVSYLLSVRGKRAVENGTIVQDSSSAFCIGPKTFESLLTLVNYFCCHSVKEAGIPEDVFLTWSFKKALNLPMRKHGYVAYSVAHYPHTASTKCKEVSLQVGDIVPLTVRHDNDTSLSNISCHMGIVNGQEGLFPADCVEIIAERQGCFDEDSDLDSDEDIY